MAGPLEVRTLRSLSVAGPDGTVPLGAASALARRGRRLFMVLDDELHLALLDLDQPGPGQQRHLFDGVLPAAPAARKAAKPDLEALVLFDTLPGHPQGALLALGSGSKPQRQRAALVALDPSGDLASTALAIDLAPLYAPLHQVFGRLNIEGAFVADGRFCLLQRGHRKAPANACIRFALGDVERWLVAGGPAPEPLDVQRFDLGALEGVPLGFTDGAALPGGGWVFCAAAEDSEDAYADGPCAGSAVGHVGSDGRLMAVVPLALRCKAEGIAFDRDGPGRSLLLVTDADDRNVAALLLATRLDAG